MPKVSESMRPYVGRRWSQWLRRSLDDAHVTPGALAREMLESPDHGREARGSPSAWIDGVVSKGSKERRLRVPTATTTFIAGQALALASMPTEARKGRKRIPLPYAVRVTEPDDDVYVLRPPAIGGLMALHAAGYFGEAIDVASALLRSDDPNARRYAARYVATVWLAHADLDGIDETKVPDHVRKFMRNFIGDAPLDALEIAWKRRQKVDALGRGLLAYCDLVDYAEMKDAIHLGAVLAWFPLVQYVGLLAKKDDVLAAQWRYAQTGFEDYWKEVMRRHDAR